MHDFSHDTLLIRVPDLVFTDMDGDLVMMSIEKGEYYGVGGVGPRVWELLEQPVSINELTASICEDYDADPDRCRADMERFTREMLDLGLITLAASTQTAEK